LSGFAVEGIGLGMVQTPKPGHRIVRYGLTDFAKLAANYLACIKLASIRIWLRANESTP